MTNSDFSQSYDNWHVWGYMRQSRNLDSDESGSSSPIGSAPDDAAESLQQLKLHDLTVPPSPSASSPTSATRFSQPSGRTRIVARVSRHCLRLEREYRLAARLQHDDTADRPLFVKPLELIKLPPRQHGDVPLVVMVVEAPGKNYLRELVEFGPNFYAYHPGSPVTSPTLSSRQPSDSRQRTSLPDFLDFAIGAVQCLRALHHPHGVVHGEIRGDAFHFNKETGHVKVINFGSGSRAFENGLTSAGWSSFTAQLDVEHKLQFIAPEQTGRLPAEPDGRTDIYSLGVLFWTMLANEPAFAGTTPLEIMQNCLTRRIPLIDTKRPDIPEVISRILQKMTQKSMSGRYQSPGGLEHDLKAVKHVLVNGDKAALDAFVIGSKDVSDAFNMPSAIIGRRDEMDILRSVIEKAVTRVRTLAGPKTVSVISSDNPDAGEDQFTASGSTASSDRDTKVVSFGQPGDALRSQHGRPSEDSVVTVATVSGGTTESRSGASSMGSGLHDVVAAGSTGTFSLLRAAHRMRRSRLCDVVTISGDTGLGKSSMLQSIQGHARGYGYYASAKFDQTDKAPFEAVFRVMASLFRQVFAESDIRTEMHNSIRALVQPVWSSLHLALELPPWLLSPDLTSAGTDANTATNSPSSPQSPSLPKSPRKAKSSTDWLYTGGGNRDRRLHCTLLDVLRVLSLQKLVCLCFDDLQSADNESLEFINGVITAGMPIVLIATYRTRDALPRKASIAVENATQVVLKPFNDSQTSEYICQTIHRSHKEVMPLVAVVQQKTGGNPFSIREMLDSCYRKKLIHYSWSTSRWEFELGKIFDLISTSNQVETDAHILLRLADLPAESRSLLAWASLIGSSFRFSLMKHVLACDCSKNSPADLIPLRTDDPISALQAAISAYAIMPTEEEDRFRFSHDRFLVASRQLRTIYSEEEMHFVIVTALTKHSPWTPAQTSKTLFSQAEHICAAVNVIRRRVPVDPYRQLLIQAAEQARMQGSSQMSLNFLCHALQLLPDDRWASSTYAQHQDVLTLVLSTASGYWDLAQYDEAHALIQDVLDHNEDPADRSSALILNSRIHARQGDSGAALVSLKQALKDLGHEIYPATWESCDDAFHALLPRLKANEGVLSETTADQVTSRSQTTGAVLVEILSAAFWTDSLMFYQLTLQLLDIYLREGPFPQVALGYIHLGTIALSRFDMVAEAVRMGAYAKTLMIQFEKEPFTCGRGLTLHALFLGHIESNVRNQLPPLLDAQEFSMMAGDRILSLLNVGAIACYRLWSTLDLAAIEAFISSQAEHYPDYHKDMRGGVFLVSIRQNVRAMLGKTQCREAATVFDDDRHNTADFTAQVKQIANEPSRPLAIYNCHRMVVLYRFGFVREALELGLELAKPMEGLFCIRHVYFWMFYLSLCLFDRIRSSQDEPARVKDIARIREFERRIKLVNDYNKANFGAWLEIIRAEMCELEKRYDEAIQGYEAAITSSVLIGAITEEALALELYSEFLIRRGSSRPAKAMVMEAIATYRRASAPGKANQLAEKHAFTITATGNLTTVDAGTQTFESNADVSMDKISRNDQDMISQTSEDRTKLWLDPQALSLQNSRDSRTDQGAESHPTGTVSSLGLDMIDLANILESSQLLSSELQIDRLLSSLTKIIVESTGAETGGIIVREEEVGWTVAAAQNRDGPIDKGIGVPLDKLEDTLARQITQYTLRFRESLFLHNVLEDERFVITPSFRQEYPEGRAMIAIPVLHGDDSLLGSIYIEGPPRSFTERNTAVLRLLVNQISISITNALLFKKLEKASASNAGMLEVQKQALAQAKGAEIKAKSAEVQAMDMVRQKEEAAKARDLFLANVSHELRTPLNGVIGLSELLKVTVLNKEQEGFADSIRVCADTLLSVINGMSSSIT